MKKSKLDGSVLGFIKANSWAASSAEKNCVFLARSSAAADTTRCEL